MRLSALIRLALPASALLLAACDALPRLTPTPAGLEVSVPGPARTAGNDGRIEVVQWPIVKIDRKELRAAPGARIFAANNMMVTPNQIPPNARVTYELDGTGQIRVLRILPTDGSGDRVGTPDTPRTAPQQ